MGFPFPAWCGPEHGCHHHLMLALNEINTKLEMILMSQSSIDADVTALTAVFTDVQAQVATLVTDVTEIQQIIAGGGTVDTSALDALVASAQSVQAGLDSAVPRA